LAVVLGFACLSGVVLDYYLPDADLDVYLLAAALGVVLDLACLSGVVLDRYLPVADLEHYLSGVVPAAVCLLGVFLGFA
jgi:hypothetical protein